MNGEFLGWRGGRNIEVNYQTRRRRLVKDSTVTGEKEAAEVFSTKLTTAAKSEPPTRSHLADPVAQFLIHQHVFYSHDTNEHTNHFPSHL